MGGLNGASKVTGEGALKPTGFLYVEEKEDTIYNKGTDLEGKYRALISS